MTKSLGLTIAVKEDFLILQARKRIKFPVPMIHTEEFYQKLVAIEEQEDTWFDRLDHYKDNTFDIVCLKTYLKEPRR